MPAYYMLDRVHDITQRMLILRNMPDTLKSDKHVNVTVSGL